MGEEDAGARMRRRRAAVLVLAAGLLTAGLATAQAAPPRDRPRADACGDPVLRADGTRWECTLAEDFDGRTLDRRRWLPQTGFATGVDGARSCHVDSPATVSVRGGTLRLSVLPAPASFDCAGYTATHYSGQVSTYRLFSQQYGRFEVRMRSTATAEPGQPGLQEAFWLWPDDRYPSLLPWPAAGEIDVAETYSQHPDLVIPFLHYTAWDNGGPVQGLNTEYCPARRGEWHTYTLTWSATELAVDVDGVRCLTNTSGDQAFQKPYIVALTQALGVAGNAHTGTAPSTAMTEVDYVRVWR